MQKLERGQLDLESSIQAYERGTALRAALRRQAAPGAAAGREADAGPRGQRQAAAVRGAVSAAALAPRPMAAVAAAVEAELDGPAAAGRRAAGAAARGHALCRAGRRQTAAAVPGGGHRRAVRCRRPGAATRVGAAIELIHGYSLVHDDLPAMDDAALRRGRPSCHRAFDEATAILAGDALQPLAFEVLARGRLRRRRRAALRAGARPRPRRRGARHVRRADDRPAWPSGRRWRWPRSRVLQRLKTGALIRVRLRGRGDPRPRAPAEAAALAGYADDLGPRLPDPGRSPGSAWATAPSPARMAGRDRAVGKATFVELLGEAGARAKLPELRARASARLDIFGGRATVLRAAVRLRDQSPIITARPESSIDMLVDAAPRPGPRARRPAPPRPRRARRSWRPSCGRRRSTRSR